MENDEDDNEGKGDFPNTSLFKTQVTLKYLEYVQFQNENITLWHKDCKELHMILPLHPLKHQGIHFIILFVSTNSLTNVLISLLDLFLE